MQTCTNAAAEPRGRPAAFQIFKGIVTLQICIAAAAVPCSKSVAFCSVNLEINLSILEITG